MEEAPERFARSRPCGRRAARRPRACRAQVAWTVPPHSTVTLLLDRGHLTTAYPEVVTSGGRGAVDHADLRGGAARRRRRAARRARRAIATRSRARSLLACATASLPDGGRAGCSGRSGGARSAMSRSRAPRPTSRSPSTTSAARFSAYPFEERGRFESSDPVLSKIWEVGWRTARLCAHETYMDTPVLGTAPVRRRHAHPGTALALRRRRRPAREERDRAVRRVAPARRPHPEPLSRRCCRRSSRRSRCSGSG